MSKAKDLYITGLHFIRVHEALGRLMVVVFQVLTLGQLKVDLIQQFGRVHPPFRHDLYQCKPVMFSPSHN